MNFIKIYTLICIASITFTYRVYPLGGGNNPNLVVKAMITTSDGTETELNEININGSTELSVYTKPAGLDITKNNPIILSYDPHDYKVGPYQLATIKIITIKKPTTIYTYQEKNGTKHEFNEIEIDGITYLIKKDWKLYGKDAGNKKNTLNLNIIRTIAIIGACAKTDTSSDQPIVNACSVPK